MTVLGRGRKIKAIKNESNVIQENDKCRVDTSNTIYSTFRFLCILEVNTYGSKRLRLKSTPWSLPEIVLLILWSQQKVYLLQYYCLVFITFHVWYKISIASNTLRLRVERAGTVVCVEGEAPKICRARLVKVFDRNYIQKCIAEAIEFALCTTIDHCDQNESSITMHAR